jgi:hypothetical protein
MTVLFGQNIPLITNVAVTMYNGAAVCVGASSITTAITFINNPGNVPTMEVVAQSTPITAVLGMKDGA